MSKDHPVWDRPDDKDGKKKISKRYGRIIKSEQTVLNSMMQQHIREVHEFLTETGNWDALEGEDASEEEGVMTGIGMLSSPPIGGGFGGAMVGGSRPVTAVSQPETPPRGS